MSHCAGAVVTGVCQRQTLRGRGSWILLHEPLQWSRMASPGGFFSRPKSLDHGHFHYQSGLPQRPPPIHARDVESWAVPFPLAPLPHLRKVLCHQNVWDEPSHGRIPWEKQT